MSADNPGSFKDWELSNGLPDGGTITTGYVEALHAYRVGLVTEGDLFVTDEEVLRRLEDLHDNFVTPSRESSRAGFAGALLLTPELQTAQAG